MKTVAVRDLETRHLLALDAAGPGDLWSWS